MQFCKTTSYAQRCGGEMKQIEATAKSWAETYGKPGEKTYTAAHDSFLIGFAAACASGVSLLRKEHEGFQGKVSYAIAADVLKMRLDEYMDRTPEKASSSEER
jgi:hypothetical protein